MASVKRLVRIAVSRFSRSKFFRAVGPTIMPPLERVTAKLTRGNRPLSGYLVPSLVLHTVGARSGLERATELMYVPEGERMLVTGSNFAREAHPAWTANLIAHPEAAVTIKGNRLRVIAEPVADDEREAVWAYIERQWPGYRGYERESGRILKIFRLAPVGPETE